MNGFLKKHLSESDLHAIAAKIAEAERATSGQIRVAIRQRRHWKERKLSLHDLAALEFHRLGMQHTTRRTGILIMLLMSERKFHIIADTGIHAKVEDGTWERIAGAMSAHFKAGNFCTGICEGVAQVGTALAKHFPKQSGDEQELPDDVVVD